MPKPLTFHPVPNKVIPALPGPTASLEETREAMAHLLEWSLDYRMGSLTDAGLSIPDLFTLKRLAAKCRRGTMGPTDHAKLQELMPILEKVRVPMEVPG